MELCVLLVSKNINTMFEEIHNFSHTFCCDITWVINDTFLRNWITSAECHPYYAGYSSCISASLGSQPLQFSTLLESQPLYFWDSIRVTVVIIMPHFLCYNCCVSIVCLTTTIILRHFLSYNSRISGLLSGLKILSYGRYGKEMQKKGERR
jgi:hypothetical protein